MNNEVYNKVTQLQDLLVEEQNTLTEIGELLEQLAKLWEQNL